MFTNIVAGLVASGLLTLSLLLWRNRLLLSVAGFGLLVRGEVRVSMSALLRVKEDDRYVLIHSPYRPASYGPPGGVVKSLPRARPFLDRLGFREHRHPNLAADMHGDLRGFLRGRELGSFLRWYASNEDRESASDCLRRELTEELTEIGQPSLVPLVAAARFTHVRAVQERPVPVPGQPYRQLRRFDVYDLDRTDESSRRLRACLLDLATSESEPGIVAATGDQIVGGRGAAGLIQPQSAFLFGRRRFRQDLPPVTR